MKRFVSRLLIAPMVALVALSVGAAAPAVASAQTPPEVWLSTPVWSMLVDRGKQVTFDIRVNNSTKVGRFVTLELVRAPEGWDPVLRDRGFVTRGVYAIPEGLESLDLQVKVPADAADRDYEFVLRATGDDFAPSTLRLVVGVKEKATEATKLTVQYPTLRGKSGTNFEFKADLRNDAEDERGFGLSAQAPEGWDVMFKPSYEQKQISDVRVKPGSSQGLDIQVTPPARVAAGEYKISVTAASGQDRSSVDLSVTVTGTYQMFMTTRTERFDTQATAGQESPFYVTFINTGSAALQDVSLSSSKPQGWAVTFQPDKIDSLEPGATREVAMMIKPSANAIAGDYMLNVSASHPQAYLDRDVRVTVQTPSIFGWIGGGILVLVVGGLMGIFMKLGRR